MVVYLPPINSSAVSDTGSFSDWTPWYASAVGQWLLITTWRSRKDDQRDWECSVEMFFEEANCEEVVGAIVVQFCGSAGVAFSLVAWTMTTTTVARRIAKRLSTEFFEDFL